MVAADCKFVPARALIVRFNPTPPARKEINKIFGYFEECFFGDFGDSSFLFVFSFCKIYISAQKKRKKINLTGGKTNAE